MADKKNSTQSTFDNLKKMVVGVKTTTTDTKLDNAIGDILTHRANSGRVRYIEYLQSLISKGASSGVDIKNLTEVGAGNMYGAGMQSARMSRYGFYESITGFINYCVRALNVLTDNILSPDDITKVSLNVQIGESTGSDTDTDTKEREIKNLLHSLNLEKNLNMICKTTLHKGDFFCEISTASEVLTARTLLTEQQLIDQTKVGHECLSEQEIHEGMEPNEILPTIDLIEERITLPPKGNERKGEEIDFKMYIDYNMYNENDSSEEEEKDKYSKSKIRLIYHNPAQVIRLQSEMYPICFGFLVFPRYYSTQVVPIEEQFINNVCQKILQSVVRQNINLDGLDEKVQTDLKDILSKFLNRSKNHTYAHVRYVPADKMQHFKVPSSKHYPYGESIFEGGQFTAKVLIALETALAIQRLSRSTEKRKILVDIGLGRDAANMVEKMKESFKKRKVSLDSFGSIDTIPSMVTTFEDIFIPQKDGKQFVDIQSYNEGNVDIRSKVDELKFLRDQLLSSLGIPSQFLNIEENSSLRSTLTEENVLFARTIISHQKYLNEQLTELINKVYQLIDPENCDEIMNSVTVHFPPPQSLQFERQSKYISDLSNMIRSLEEIGVPKEYARKKFLTQIDWLEIEKYEIDSKIDKTVEGGEDDQGGMGSY